MKVPTRERCWVCFPVYKAWQIEPLSRLTAKERQGPASHAAYKAYMV